MAVYICTIEQLCLIYCMYIKLKSLKKTVYHIKCIVMQDKYCNMNIFVFMKHVCIDMLT